MRNSHRWSRIGVAASLAAIVAAQPTTFAQSPPIEVAELLAADGVAQQTIAESVAIDGDRIVLGARLDDVLGDNAGAAYVFVGTGGIWGQQTRLTADVADPGDVFGIDVGVSGDTIVVGAPGDDDLGSSAGAAYVFTYTGTEWVQEAKLLASDGSETAFFGGAVAIEGDWILVTARHDDLGGMDAGAAYAFERSGTAWTERAILRPMGAAAGDRFGTAVDMSGNQAVIGATGVGAKGGAYLFGRVGTTWIEGPLLETTMALAEELGEAVAISGDLVALGDRKFGVGQQGDSGRVFIFERSGTMWPEIAALSGSPQSQSQFGASIDIDGVSIVVGERNRNRIYRFERIAGQWEKWSVTPLDAIAGDSAGHAIAAHGAIVVAGAPSHGHLGPSSGAAYVFSLEPNPLPSFCFGNGGDQMGCTPCPCGNNAPAGKRGGCTNSTGLNCVLKASGIPSASSDSLRFDVEGANILTFALLVSADIQLPMAGACPPGSGINGSVAPLDGLRCIGVNLRRHGTRPTNFDGNNVDPWGPPGSPVAGLISRGNFVAGQTRQFQVIYREISSLGCGTGLNTSNGVTTEFVP